MSFKCGWGQSDITPSGKVELRGQYYQRISKDVHSNLKITALLMESNRRHALFISMDMVSVKQEFVELARKSLKQNFPWLNTDRITLNATHTHSSFSFGSGRNWWKTDNPQVMTNDEAVSFLLEKLNEAVAMAKDSLIFSGIANALTRVSIGHCRRAVYDEKHAEMYGDTTRKDFSHMEGGEDSGIELMLFYNDKHQPTGVIVNVACPAQIMEATYSISSDFAGRCRELLQQHFGSDFQMLYQVSAAGCQSPRDLTRQSENTVDYWSEKGVEFIGQKLYKAVCCEFEKVNDINFYPVFKTRKLDLRLPFRTVCEEDYLNAVKNINVLTKTMPEQAAFNDFCKQAHANEKLSNQPGPYDNKLHHFVQIKNNQAVIDRFELLKYQKYLDIEVQIVRIGDCVFASNPFELYLNYGQRIKAKSPASQTFIIQLANGAYGYLPSERAEKLGGYGGLVINGRVGSKGGKILCDETLKAIQEIFVKN